MFKCLSSLFFLISFNVYADVWYQIGYNNTELECPDVIEIKGQRYVISNECYGHQKSNFQIESGFLVHNQFLITFSERQITSRSFLQGLSKSLSLDIEQLASGEVRLRQGLNQFHFIVID